MNKFTYLNEAKNENNNVCSVQKQSEGFLSRYFSSFIKYWKRNFAKAWFSLSFSDRTVERWWYSASGLHFIFGISHPSLATCSLLSVFFSLLSNGKNIGLFLKSSAKLLILRKAATKSSFARVQCSVLCCDTLINAKYIPLIHSLKMIHSSILWYIHSGWMVSSGTQTHLHL